MLWEKGDDDFTTYCIDFKNGSMVGSFWGCM